jgi:hypothetical protein
MNLQAMGIFWLWMVVFMADVMAQNHGGDGGDDGPPPFGHDLGHHQVDGKC